MEMAPNSDFLVLQVIYIILILPNLGLNLVHCTSYAGNFFYIYNLKFYSDSISFFPTKNSTTGLKDNVL